MEKKYDRYSYEQVLGSFQGEVARFQNDISRIPARKAGKDEVRKYAEEVYNKSYADALHPSVLEQYD